MAHGAHYIRRKSENTIDSLGVIAFGLLSIRAEMSDVGFLLHTLLRLLIHALYRAFVTMGSRWLSMVFTYRDNKLLS